MRSKGWVHVGGLSLSANLLIFSQADLCLVPYPWLLLLRGAGQTSKMQVITVSAPDSLERGSSAVAMAETHNQTPHGQVSHTPDGRGQEGLPLPSPGGQASLVCFAVPECCPGLWCPRPLRGYIHIQVSREGQRKGALPPHWPRLNHLGHSPHTRVGLTPSTVGTCSA